MLFSVLFANAVIALIVGAQGVGSINSVNNGNMLYAMVPLPFLLFGFKWYCKRAFDDKLIYYSTIPLSDIEGLHHPDHPKHKKGKLASRFGHPALYKKLLTPMVHAKSQHLLKEIYGHRSNADKGLFEAPHRRSTDRAMPSTPGYERFSEYFNMTEMDSHDLGHQTTSGAEIPQMELVSESELDFENFKKREEFRDQFGGDGELYGPPDDMSRPGTPSTFTTLTEMGPYGRHRDSPSGSGASSRTRLGDMDEGTSYAKGYQKATGLDDGFEDVGIDVSIPVTPFDGDAVLRGRSSRQPLVSADEREDGADFFDRRLREDTSYERFRHNR
jgi:hypothetical protein